MEASQPSRATFFAKIPPLSQIKFVLASMENKMLLPE